MRTATLRERTTRLAEAREGTAAIEFAFVAGPFLLMIFAIIELALVFLLSTSLDTASDQTSRRIRTGQFQSANETETKFKTDLCAKMSWLANDCANRLYVKVTTHTDFTSIQAFNPVTDRKINTGEMGFPPAIPRSTVVVVRSYYRWPLISPFMNQALDRVEGGNALISSTQTFQTEPF